MGEEFLDEKEITEDINLCNSNGTLNKESIGWSRKSLFDCNLKGRWLRKKRWNYWSVISPECLFSVTVSNIDYAGMVFAYFYDFKTKKFIEKTVMTPFGKGCKMPSGVHETVSFINKQMNADLIAQKNDTRILCYSADFGSEKLSADFTVNFPENHETLNVVIPWNEKTFQFTSKQEALPVEGFLIVGEETYNFSRENTFACLDFGRGIWPYKVYWNWANASAIIDGRSVGINLGAKWTDGTGMTENALVIDGKIIKLSENIIYNYDKNDYMKNWFLKTEISDRVNLEFTPFYERIAKSDLKIIKSEVHQMFGYFNGYIRDKDNNKIIFKNIIGCAEDHFGQW